MYARTSVASVTRHGKEKNGVYKNENEAFPTIFVLLFHSSDWSLYVSPSLQWLPHYSRNLQDSDSEFQTVTRLTRVITQSGGAIRASPRASEGLWLSTSIYFSLFLTRLPHLAYNYSAHKYLNSRSLLYLLGSSPSLPLAIGISVPVGATTHYYFITVDTGHVPRNTSRPPNAYSRTAPKTHPSVRASALRFIQIPFFVIPRLVPHCLLGHTYSSLSDMTLLLNV